MKILRLSIILSVFSIGILICLYIAGVLNKQEMIDYLGKSIAIFSIIGLCSQLVDFMIKKK